LGSNLEEGAKSIDAAQVASRGLAETWGKMGTGTLGWRIWNEKEAAMYTLYCINHIYFTCCEAPRWSI
jgi:hypothetical protein